MFFCQLSGCTGIYRYFHYRLQPYSLTVNDVLAKPYSPTVNDALAFQAAAWRTFWSLSPSSAEANIRRFKLRLYCSIYQPRLRSQMWGENLLHQRREEATSWPCFLFFRPEIQQELYSFTPKTKRQCQALIFSLSFLWVFSIQITGFSKTNSGPLVTSSTPWFKINFI